MLVILIILPHLFNIITNYRLCHSRDPTMTVTKSYYGASQDELSGVAKTDMGVH